MDKIEIKTIVLQDQNEYEYVFITHSDNSITSMPKSTYDEMIAKQEKQSGTL